MGSFFLYCVVPLFVLLAFSYSLIRMGMWLANHKIIVETRHRPVKLASPAPAPKPKTDPVGYATKQ